MHIVAAIPAASDQEQSPCLTKHNHCNKERMSTAQDETTLPPNTQSTTYHADPYIASMLHQALHIFRPDQTTTTPSSTPSSKPSTRDGGPSSTSSSSSSSSSSSFSSSTPFASSFPPPSSEDLHAIRAFVMHPDPSRDVHGLNDPTVRVFAATADANISMSNPATNRFTDQIAFEYLYVPSRNRAGFALGYFARRKVSQTAARGASPDKPAEASAATNYDTFAVGRYIRNDRTGEMLHVVPANNYANRNCLSLVWLAPPTGVHRVCLKFICEFNSNKLTESDICPETVLYFENLLRVSTSTCAKCASLATAQIPNQSRNSANSTAQSHGSSAWITPRMSSALSSCGCSHRLIPPEHAADFANNFRNISIHQGSSSGTVRVMHNANPGHAPAVSFDKSCQVSIAVHRKAELVQRLINIALERYASSTVPFMIPFCYLIPSGLPTPSSTKPPVAPPVIDRTGLETSVTGTDANASSAKSTVEPAQSTFSFPVTDAVSAQTKTAGLHHAASGFMGPFPTNMGWPIVHPWTVEYLQQLSGQRLPTGLADAANMDTRGTAGQVRSHLEPVCNMMLPPAPDASFMSVVQPIFPSPLCKSPENGSKHLAATVSKKTRRTDLIRRKRAMARQLVGFEETVTADMRRKLSNRASAARSNLKRKAHFEGLNRNLDEIRRLAADRKARYEELKLENADLKTRVHQADIDRLYSVLFQEGTAPMDLESELGISLDI